LQTDEAITIGTNSRQDRLPKLWDPVTQFSPLHNRAEIRNTVLVSVVLAAATVAAFWPATTAQFVSLDDPLYVSDNLRVQRGLTADNLKWAFTTFDGGLWQPLTWLSVMLDCQLFGVNPVAMHRVNLAFHAASGVLLFLMLKGLTRALWPSAIVAALFALHPLRVESVAWIAERKDVLSTFFWILTMWGYAEYVRRRPPPAVMEGDAKTNPARLLGGTGCTRCYILAILFFALGLMSKAMLVTLPFVLLLADVWPLRRMDVQAPRWWMNSAQLRGLVLDKLPFFALAAGSIFVTLLAPHHREGVTSFVQLPLGARIANAIVSYGRYLAKTFWPTDLAVFYPFPAQWPASVIAGAAALIAIVSVVAIVTFRRAPWCFVGWFWFVGTLVPVLGIVQVGGQSIADRFTYVPSIGLFIALVWTARELGLAHRAVKIAGPIVAGTIIVLCAVMTHRQAAYWKNNATLFAHALRVAPPSVLVLNGMGTVLLEAGRTNDAMQNFKAALKLNPEDAQAWGNIAYIYFQQGALDEAIQHYEQGLRHKPNHAQLHFNLALALAAKGQFADAIRHFERQLMLTPFDFNGYLYLGNAYLSFGNPNAAGTNYLAALRLKPDSAAIHYNLGNVRLAQGQVEDAIKHFSAAARLERDFVDVHRQLGLALQRAGRNAEALSHLERALALSPAEVGVRADLAALHTRLGNGQAAIAQYREALKLDPNAPGVLNNLAWLLATHPDEALRDGAEAVRLAERAVELTARQQPFLLGTLAAACAEMGRFDDAIKTADEAIRLAEQQGQNAAATKNRELLGHYRERRPWREPLPKP
jgi:protein O-mannosyl-transferase